MSDCIDGPDSNSSKQSVGVATDVNSVQDMDLSHVSDASDLQKVEFLNSAFNYEWKNEAEPDKNVKQAIQWIARTSPKQRIQHREETIAWIEEIASEARAKGLVDAWFKSSTQEVRRVSEEEEVNGYISELLAKYTEFHDLDSGCLFRDGGPTIEKFALSGNGTPKEFPEHASVENWKKQCGARNRKLVASLKEDELSEALHKATIKDASLGRMTETVRPSRCRHRSHCYSKALRCRSGSESVTGRR